MKDKIIGLVVAEKINSAYQVLLETRSYRELDLNSAVDVKVGINKLWVHVSLRKHKLATRLCEVVRYSIAGLLFMTSFSQGYKRYRLVCVYCIARALKSGVPLSP